MRAVENTAIWLGLAEACVPILVALVGIIPTIINNRKKTQASIETLQETLDAHIREDEDDKARQARLRIIRFNDELCENRPHSESYFEDILDDIDFYEAYCDSHPGFRNNRGHTAMEHTKAVYTKLKNKGKFLTHTEVE